MNPHTIIQVAFCNVPVKVGRDAWETCFQRTLTHGDIFGLNETMSPKQRQLYRRMAKSRGLRIRGLQTPNPLVFNPDLYRPTGFQVLDLHDELPTLRKQYPGYNAARQMSVLHVTHKESGIPLTVAFSHFVPNGKKVDPKERRQARRASLQAVRRQERLARKEGRLFIFLGDTNIKGTFWVSRKFRWLWGQTIDKLGVSASGRQRIASARASNFDAPTDHGNGGVAAVIKVRSAD